MDIQNLSILVGLSSPLSSRFWGATPPRGGSGLPRIPRGKVWPVWPEVRGGAPFSGFGACRGRGLRVPGIPAPCLPEDAPHSPHPEPGWGWGERLRRGGELLPRTPIVCQHLQGFLTPGTSFVPDVLSPGCRIASGIPEGHGCPSWEAQPGTSTPHPNPPRPRTFISECDLS